ncbi:unnamed protein product, partial [Cuscuta europaea]
MLDQHNVHVKSFRMARDRFNNSVVVDFKLKLIGTRHNNGRVYNEPEVNEVAAIIEGDIDASR